MNSRVGGSNDEIVIRPPIGQRSDYTVATGYNGSSANGLNLPGVLIAGYQAATSLFVVEGAVNSGFAWTEIELTGAGDIDCFANSGPAKCLFYEIVSRVYDCDTCGDRGGVRTSGGASATMYVTGSYLAGSKGLPPQDHADSFQYSGDDRGSITIEDSYIWPSWDKALQAGAAEQFLHQQLLDGDARPCQPVLALRVAQSRRVLHDHWSHANRRFDTGGATHPQFDTRISNTEWFNPANSLNRRSPGGNTPPISRAPAGPTASTISYPA